MLITRVTGIQISVNAHLRQSNEFSGNAVSVTILRPSLFLALRQWIMYGLIVFIPFHWDSDWDALPLRWDLILGQFRCISIGKVSHFYKEKKLDFLFMIF